MLSTRHPLLGPTRDLLFHWLWHPASLSIQQGGAETLCLLDRETVLSLEFPRRGRGIKPGGHRFGPRFVGVVDVWTDF